MTAAPPAGLHPPTHAASRYDPLFYLRFSITRLIGTSRRPFGPWRLPVSPRAVRRGVFLSGLRRLVLRGPSLLGPEPLQLVQHLAIRRGQWNRVFWRHAGRHGVSGVVLSGHPRSPWLHTCKALPRRQVAFRASGRRWYGRAMTAIVPLAAPPPDFRMPPASGTEPAPLILALPKGRILAECGPLLEGAGIVPDPEYSDEDSRRLRFPTSNPALDVVRVRPFDVATFVAFGAAQLGICGADVLAEFDYSDIYAPLDLGIGACRISVAEPAATAGQDDPRTWSRVRVATKYPNTARRHFAARGIQAEVVHLNGAMELAPGLGLTRLIVDLVATGSTLRANGLVETEVIAHVTSRLIVNRTALKTRPEEVGGWIARFRAALAHA